MCQPRMNVLSEAPEIAREALAHPLVVTLESKEARKLIEEDENLAEFAEVVVSNFQSGEIPDPSSENFEADFKKWAKALGKKTSRKGKGLFMPLRLLLTGRMQGPEVPHQLALAEKASDKITGALCLRERIDNINTALELLHISA
mmetsp:Transcript_29356/g.40923  ORF Transcript_29356/g.40923 Transcript_29356/m.40923 type:complete len:145 (+) Transcript_29356:764-1198(+)